MRDRFFAEREDWGPLLHFSVPFQASFLISFEVFFLEDLFTPGSLPSDHIPKNLAAHGNVLDGHISNLKPPLHFGLRNLVPAHQMQLLFIISATFPEKTTEQLSNLVCNGIGSKKD